MAENLSFQIYCDTTFGKHGLVAFVALKVSNHLIRLTLAYRTWCWNAYIIMVYDMLSPSWNSGARNIFMANSAYDQATTCSLGACQRRPQLCLGKHVKYVKLTDKLGLMDFGVDHENVWGLNHPMLAQFTHDRELVLHVLTHAHSHNTCTAIKNNNLL